MDARLSVGEQDGTQRWCAGLPSLGVLPADAVADVHRAGAARALQRLRRGKKLLALSALALPLYLLALARVPALLWPTGPLALFALVYGPRLAIQVWQARRLAAFVDPLGLHGRVERFEGRLPLTEGRVFRAESAREPADTAAGPGKLRLDVLVDVGLVVAVDGHLPKADHYLPVQLTSDRLGGTEQGRERLLCVNERIELRDLARHDSAWRPIVRGLPALPVVVVFVVLFFSMRGAYVLLLLVLVAALSLTAFDLVAAYRRRKRVRAAAELATVRGGVNSLGQQVEVLLPDKLLWTVAGRPAPERLRPRSRALEGAITGGRERHAPTTF